MKVSGSDGQLADGMSASLDLYSQGLAKQHQESKPALPPSRERWPMNEREVLKYSFYGCTHSRMA